MTDSLDLIPTEGQSAALMVGLHGLQGARLAAPFIAKAAKVAALRAAAHDIRLIGGLDDAASFLQDAADELEGKP